MDLEVHADDRGSVAEVFRNEWFAGRPPFVQGNVGRSRARVLRGLHYHRRQADLWVPIDGRIQVGLVDVRPGSPAERRALTFEAEPGVALYLPPGVAHGYLATTELALLYLVDRTYDGSDEFGFSAFDRQVGIDWAVPDPILSPRDRDAPSLADALARAPVDPFPG